MKTFVITNQKGGVGKTTTTLNLGVGVARLGYKVLLVDMDPQANLSTGLGVRVNSESDESSIYDVLVSKLTISDVFRSTHINNLYIVPSSISLAGAEIELVSAISRERVLDSKLGYIREQFDFVFIDTPPSLGLLTINSLTASDGIIIPIQCEYFALEGVSQLLNTIDLIKGINPKIELTGVILTMFDRRTKLSEDVAKEIKEFFGSKLFDIVIPRNVRIAEAPSYGKDIFSYDDKSVGAVAYSKLAKDFIARIMYNSK